MPSHWSTIGFDVKTLEDAAALARMLIDDAQSIRTNAGQYLRLRGGNGEEVWLQVNAKGEVVGINPHFEGEATMRVGLVSRVQREDDGLLDGALYAWADPQADDAITDGAYPFVFDLPDAAVYAELALPSIQTARIAAFAHTMTVHESLAAYDTSQAGEALKFASRSFIPEGLLSGSEGNEPPRAEVSFTGHVVKSAMKTNAMTGAPFGWALVETLGGTYDVVFDGRLSEKAPVVGGVLHGSFWLSGRLTSVPKRRRGWRSFFGRS